MFAINDAGYGLWPLVVLNSVLFIVLAGSFFHPQSGRDWKAMGAFSGGRVVRVPADESSLIAAPANSPTRSSATASTRSAASTQKDTQ